MPEKLRILFVDDEPRVLRGLRRQLDSLADDWEMVFVDSGAKALDTLRLAAHPFDAIIADMRMPGMDGATLLKAVKARHPNVIRIVLSGQADKAAVLRTVGLAHQYLSKPCDTETLKSTLRRARTLRDLLTANELKELISQLSTLPSLPALYYELLAELESPEASIKAVGQIIARDLGMTAKMLQLVNSAFFGLPQRISDPVQATILLGLDMVRSLALSAQVFSHFDRVALKGITLDALWEHSLAVSALAGQIAETEGAERYVIGCALTAGSLHDVGKLVLAANLPDKYAAALDLMAAQEIDLGQAERSLFGATHAEVGAYLLGLWGLSDPIVEAVAYHHQPSKGPDQEFTPLTAVHVANVLAHQLLTPTSPPGTTEFDTGYLSRLGLIERLPIWRNVCRKLAEGKEK
ncbi:MAG: response regulator [Chloroflexota bacterium]